MKLGTAVIVLCLFKTNIAEDYVFQFDLGDKDNDDYTETNSFHYPYKNDKIISKMLVEKDDDIEEDFTEIPKTQLKNKEDIITEQTPKVVQNIEYSIVKNETKDVHTEKYVNKDPNAAKAKQNNQEDTIHKKSEELTQKVVVDHVNVKRKGGTEGKKTPYRGESFPKKYLELDATDITLESLRLYINSVNRTVNYFLNFLNNSDVNVALGLYLTATLKHSIKIYGEMMDKELTANLKYIIKAADNILSHYLSMLLHGEYKDMEYKVAQLLRDDSVVMESLKIEQIKAGRFNKWIFSDGSQMHQYVREMDEAKLPKEQYVALVESMDGYYVSIDESDECITRIADLPYPTSIAGPMRRCRPDSFCEDAIHSSPSVAYALSHRMFNLMFRRVHRRCYLRSERSDGKHLDQLCSFMYREAVYIARRGYFARDLFLEHIILCSLLGYEEFFRPSWFRKAAGWVDDRGCTAEFINFEVNRTKLFAATNSARLPFARDRLKQTCHHHPMALMMVAQSMGIRYALHRFPPIRP